MNPSSKSLTSGSRKGSRLTGRESGNRYDGTNPTVYTSTVCCLSCFETVATWTSIAPTNMAQNKQMNNVPVHLPF